MKHAQLSDDIKRWNEIIEKKARAVGLDFFNVVFEMVDYREINELAALGGFPTRYPHWRFGMDYDRLEKNYSYGLSKIYEMVINNDPCIAYLLSSNSLLEQKLVMAHVYGHADFFKHNYYFSQTNRKMLDTMANNSMRVRNIQARLGVDKVEEFIDQCLSLDNLIDMRSVGMPTPQKNKEENVPSQEQSIHRFVTKSYMDKFVNTDEYIDKQKKKIAEEAIQKKSRFPDKPERDVLLFLLENAPLDDWQQDILSIIREEAYYFAPQGQTKIMNEGWASYWHSFLMTNGILNDSEIIDYASTHSGTMATEPGGFNPYKIGIELFRHIEERWNKGRFGKDWDQCDDIQKKQKWDLKTGLGRQKIFEVRKVYNDLTFVDTFLTEDFCKEQKLFSFAMNHRSQQLEVASREFKDVKESLLKQLTNFGNPVIEITEANYMNRGELLLLHHHQGMDLRPDYADLTLRNLHALWKRPVNIQTLVEDKIKILSFDGSEYKET